MVREVAILVHVIAALITIGAFIVHVYMGVVVVPNGSAIVIGGSTEDRAAAPGDRSLQCDRGLGRAPGAGVRSGRRTAGGARAARVPGAADSFSAVTRRRNIDSADVGLPDYLEWLAPHAPAPVAQTRNPGSPPLARRSGRRHCRGVHRRSLAARLPSRSVSVLHGARRVAVARSRTRRTPIAICAECVSPSRRRRGWVARRAANSASRRCRSFAATTPSRRASMPATPAMRT